MTANAFEYTCAKNDIKHRTTKPKQPSIKGQVERMNRTIKDESVKPFHPEVRDHLRCNLAAFVAAYNVSRRLNTLKGHTPRIRVCLVRDLRLRAACSPSCPTPAAPVVETSALGREVTQPTK